MVCNSIFYSIVWSVCMMVYYRLKICSIHRITDWIGYWTYHKLWDTTQIAVLHIIILYLSIVYESFINISYSLLAVRLIILSNSLQLKSPFACLNVFIFLTRCGILIFVVDTRFQVSRTLGIIPLHSEH
jgi:hypothetical protein